MLFPHKITNSSYLRTWGHREGDRINCQIHMLTPFLFLHPIVVGDPQPTPWTVRLSWGAYTSVPGETRWVDRIGIGVDQLQTRNESMKLDSMKLDSSSQFPGRINEGEGRASLSIWQAVLPGSRGKTHPGIMSNSFVKYHGRTSYRNDLSILENMRGNVNGIVANDVPTIVPDTSVE